LSWWQAAQTAAASWGWYDGRIAPATKATPPSSPNCTGAKVAVRAMRTTPG
jgi:hypothetical protein